MVTDYYFMIDNIIVILIKDNGVKDIERERELFFACLTWKEA